MKENQNKLDTNLWGGGEYDNSLKNIQCNQDNQKCTISHDYSTNGETSFKLIRGGGTGYNWTRFRYPTTTAGQTLTCTVKVYSPNAEADIWLCDLNSNTEGGHSGTHLYPSDKVQEISLTYTGTLTSVNYYALRVNLINDDTYLYIDDLSLTTS